MRSLPTALIAWLFAGLAAAQQVIVVDAAGGGDFTEIQPAVDAAPVGGLIRVRYGEYPGDVVINKGIRLVGDRYVRVANAPRACIKGSITVEGLPTDQMFVAADLYVPVSSTELEVFKIENCRGNVHLANSVGRLEVRNCSYVSTDLFSGGTYGLNPAAIVRDSFLVSSDSTWSSFSGTVTPVKATRSKLIFTDGEITNFNFGEFDPTLPAVQLTDSEMIYTGDLDIRVNPWCDPTWPYLPPCPSRAPEIVQIGNSTAENLGGGSHYLAADIHQPDLLQLRYGASDSLLFAVIASLPGKPIALPQGALFIDPATSLVLHLCPPSTGPFSTIRINLTPPRGNRFGVPITFQAAAFRENGDVAISLPLTTVF